MESEQGVPPHAFTSAPDRTIDNAVSIPIEAVRLAVKECD
jgi:hypothetical protein